MEQTQSGGTKGRGADRADDPLRRLEAQLERASAAAERLFMEAATEAGAAAVRMGERIKPPPSGWQTASDSTSEARSGGDFELLLAVFDSVRDLVPAELRRRLAEALKDLLLALRALIDWYLERLDRGRREPAEVEDIPVL
jgi:hypothetical protein